jgi:hypothetical protein
MCNGGWVWIEEYQWGAIPELILCLLKHKRLFVCLCVKGGVGTSFISIAPLSIR